MTERPILFSGPMVRAILDGRKTETRRAVKPQLTHGYHRWAGEGSDPGDHMFIGPTGNHLGTSRRCPYGKPGDLLYVRETWAPKHWRRTRDAPPKLLSAYFRASYTGDSVEAWRPSIHMPKSAARIWLRVTEVAVERVQDITNEDAEAEGIEWEDAMEYADEGSPDFVLPFAKLWDAINAKRGFSWWSNPWVWVVRFEVVSTTGRPAEVETPTP